jgi:hypothetical protein
MTRGLAMAFVISLLLTGCRTGRWVEDVEVPVVKCRGGTVNTERRTTDTSVLGRTRVTTTRTDACID